MSWEDGTTQSAGNFVQLFQGATRIEREWHCFCCRREGLNKSNAEEFRDLSLSLPAPTTTRIEAVTLRHCLDAFVSEEKLSGDNALTCEHW